MLGAVTALLILLTFVPFGWATSKADNVCGTLLRLEQVSTNAAATQTRNGVAPAAQAQFKEHMAALRVATIYGEISADDLARLEAYAEGSAQLATTNLLGQLISSNDCIKETHSEAPADPATGKSGLIVSTNESGLGGNGGSAGRSGSVSPEAFSIAASAIALCLLALIAAAWFFEKVRRARAMHPCTTKALLVYGDNCTVTAITKIGRYGAHLQSPSVKIPAQGLDLYVAGQKISAKKKSDMKYFMKLAFSQPLSQTALDTIIRPSSCQDQLSEIGENATPCFFPGCHHNCDKHRATAMSTRGTGAPAFS